MYIYIYIFCVYMFVCTYVCMYMYVFHVTGNAPTFTLLNNTYLK